MPRISVVVPVYNAEKYIGETLDGIAAQRFADFDVHIVDDCSTDGSAAIVQAFCARDSRFHYHRSPSNFGGPAGPRNLGIAASSSEFVAFCDADDVWVAHKLEVQLAVAEATGAEVISAVIRDFADGDPLPRFPRPHADVPWTAISHRRLLLKNWIALSSVLARRSALDAAGPFNPAKNHVAVEDFDMWLRITGMGGRVVRVGVPLVHYRKLPTSISASKSMMIRKALNVIGEDYGRRGRAGLFRVIRPLHWFLYVATSAWMRAVRREL
ncbi:glycosyltransferase family 2 protein [Sphingopyxis granuli]|uniref:glycosyltransferase family 2 protein n=1 Tax=Sphingopyxis granuli TaxID=267128 RepID=UPI001BAF2AC6|nr:glycosyltransferase [Sphingopyxis granuli]QUM71331.1 glycosyltransferase [Sphingopyxis granuli]